MRTPLQSRPRGNVRSRPGFLLIELALGMTLLVMFLGAFAISLIEGQIGGQAAGNRVRGIEAANKSLQAAMNIRDQNFALLQTGQYGVKIDSGTGLWKFSGTQTAGSGGFTTTLNIKKLSADTAFLEAHTSWQITPNRAGDTYLSALITDWKSQKTTGRWSAMALTGSYIDAGSPSFNSILVSSGSAFVTSEQSGGGRGLYVFNVMNATNPTYISSSFSLGHAGYGMGLKNNILYVITDSSAAEIHPYDVTDPSNPVALPTKDIPGSADANDAYVYGDYLFVSASDLGPYAVKTPEPERVAVRESFLHLIPQANAATFCFDQNGLPIACGASSSAASSAASAASEIAAQATHDFFVFDIRNPSNIRLVASLNASAGVNGISVTGTSAYLASDHATAELRVVNIAKPDAPAFATGSVNGAPNGGYNLTDRSTLRGTSVTNVGTAALLGTERQNGIQELVVLKVPAGNGIPPSGFTPWYHYASGTVVKVATDPSGCYAFVATNWKTKAVQVIKLADSSLPELASYAPGAPGNFGARNMFYDPSHDLLYMINRKGLYIFVPGPPPNDCP